MGNPDVDLVIAGGGPAGATLALNLAGSGIRIAVVEKKRFPRGVICGDALSGQVLQVLRRLPGTVYREFLELVPKTPSRGMRVYAPDHGFLDLPYELPGDRREEPPGYICPRISFDDFLFQHLKQIHGITILEEERISRVRNTGEQVIITTNRQTFSSRMIAGADGIRSVVRSCLSTKILDPSYYCLAFRTYFSGITGFPPGNHLELFFLEDLLPAYFWIFPEVGGSANVGLGILYRDLIRKKMSMFKVLQRIIREHPLIAPRFRQAVMTGKPGARGLALSRKLDNLSGDRFLLLGDAALLVDPFTGEGVGNAMASGESAAHVIRDCFRNGDFSAKALRAYDLRLKRRIGTEHTTSVSLQRFARQPWLFNLVVRKANSHAWLREQLISSFYNEADRKKLADPLFYGKLLLKPFTKDGD